MADTLTNTALPAGTWVDLYADTGIAVGTKINVQNLGSSTVWLTVNATAPADGTTRNELSPGNDKFSNDASDSGAWAYSPVVDGLVNVEVA